MATDYENIRKDIQKRYGSHGAKELGETVSEDLYTNKAHFIYELLQNAEDAMARRSSDGDRYCSVYFYLDADELRVEHYR